MMIVKHILRSLSGGLKIPGTAAGSANSNILRTVSVVAPAVNRAVIDSDTLIWIPRRTIHLSAGRQDLMEFFDNKKNWGETVIKVGRSWRIDELRIRSNTDLHKLWYAVY